MCYFRFFFCTLYIPHIKCWFRCTTVVCFIISLNIYKQNGKSTYNYLKTMPYYMS